MPHHRLSAVGATAAALGLEEIGIFEITRGTAFGASRMSIGCSFSLEPALVMDFGSNCSAGYRYYSERCC